MARVAAALAASRVAGAIRSEGADSSVADAYRRKRNGPLNFVRNAMRTTLGAPGPSGHDSMVPTRVGEGAERLLPGNPVRRHRPPDRALDGPRTPGACPVPRGFRSALGAPAGRLSAIPDGSRSVCRWYTWDPKEKVP